MELVVVLAIAAILVGVAVPAFDDTVRRHRIVTDINHLNASLQAARSEAVRRRASAVVCPSENGYACSTEERWEIGWMAFMDPDGDGLCAAPAGAAMCDDGGRILQRTGELVDGTLRANGAASLRVRYTARGTADGYLATFTRCSADGRWRSGFTLTMTGRLRRVDETALTC